MADDFAMCVMNDEYLHLYCESPFLLQGTCRSQRRLPEAHIMWLPACGSPIFISVGLDTLYSIAQSPILVVCAVWCASQEIVGLAGCYCILLSCLWWFWKLHNVVCWQCQVRLAERRYHCVLRISAFGEVVNVMLTITMLHWQVCHKSSTFNMKSSSIRTTEQECLHKSHCACL